MKQFFLIAAIFATSITAKAQTIQYTYDKNGGAILRKLYVCPSCPDNQRKLNPPNSLDTSVVQAEKHIIGVFPNPTQEMLNVNITNVETTEIVNLYLSDETGRSLFNLKNQPAISVVNMTNYKTGVYYLQVKVGDESPKVFKVMKIE